ncbi:MAG: Hsp20/alpha crystallin family protein [Candidatus Odinarchaeota archaeon]
MSEDKKIDIKKGKELKKEKNEKKSRELSIRRETPFSLFQEMDRMFNDLWRNFDESFWPFGRRRYEPIKWDEIPIFRTPLSNITEDENNYSISAELPGLNKGDLEITFHDGMLEIKGEQKEEQKEEKEGYVRREFSSASYYRAFSLPENIDEEAIDANLNKGILKIKIPKKAPKKIEKKKIEVK